MRQGDPALDRFSAKFDITESGCWEWTAGRGGNGYGCFWTGEGNANAHRYAYTCGDIESECTE